MATITWTDKILSAASGLPENKKVTVSTMAEIKSVVNTNAGELVTAQGDIATLEGISGAVPFHYQFDTSTVTSSPAVGYFRLNNAKPDLTTQIHVNSTDENIDVHDVLATLTNDHYIYIQNRQTNTLSSVFKVTTTTDNTTWFTFGVTYVSGASTAYTADDLFVFSPVFTPLTTAGTGTVTSVTAGTGATQTGTSSINPTINVIGGKGITANSGDIQVTYTGVDNYIEKATDLTTTDIALADRINYSDDTDGDVKMGNVSDLPFRTDFTVSSPITDLGNVIGHMNTDGSKHVPANSTTNDGKVLTASAVAGTYTWEKGFRQLQARTGLTLVFDDYAEYNAITPLTTGNITINPSGAVAGAYVAFYFNGATEPTISGAVAQMSTGTFYASGLNIYHFFWNNNGKYVLNIQNEAVVLTQLSTPVVAAVAGDELVNLTFSSIDANATINVLDRSTDDITYANVAGYNGTDLTYQDTGLTNTQIYYYRFKSQASGYTDSAYGTDNATPAAGASWLLDTYTTATGAYSLRKLKTGATNCLRLWRDTDSAETDLILETDGSSITMSSLVSAGGTLSTWVGANQARVTKWYDQSGQGNDLVQAASGSMPRLVQGGVLQVSNVLASVWHASTSQNTAISGSALFGITNMDARSIFTVTTPVDPPIAGDTVFKMGGGTASEYNLLLDYGVSADGTDIIYDAAASDDTQALIISILPTSATDLSDNNVWVDSVALGVSTADTTTLTTTDDFLSTIGQKKQFQELIIFPDDQTSNRATIQTDINDHYSVYV